MLAIKTDQDPVGTPTEATKGVVLIYAKNGIDFKPKELESFFIETTNTTGKNAIIGTIYRHPSMDQTTFLDD